MGLLEKLKNVLGRDSGELKFGRVPAVAVEHPVLGSLNPDMTHSHTLVGRVAYGDQFIEVQVSPDDKTMEEAIALAVDAAASLACLDQKCRSLIAKDCLESYNIDWRFGQRSLDDGTIENFEKPLLSEAEFCGQLKFQSVEATGSSLLTFWYGDGDMFWGHSLYVDSFDGVEFGDTHVSMFG